MFSIISCKQEKAKQTAKKQSKHRSITIKMDGYQGVKMDLDSLGSNREVQRQAMYAKKLFE